VTGRGDLASKAPAPVQDSAFKDDGLQANERNLASVLAAEKARKEARDVVLNEAVRILGDAVGIAKSDPRLAARIRTGPVPLLVPN
jgi:carboxyl-terminal processing protease